jgi:hypothetical protein
MTQRFRGDLHGSWEASQNAGKDVVWLELTNKLWLKVAAVDRLMLDLNTFSGTLDLLERLF